MTSSSALRSDHEVWVRRLHGGRWVPGRRLPFDSAGLGNAAIPRHIYLAESELDGKATTTRIGALQVSQKQDGAWKLLARQGFQLPA